jgi:hypothetical protein
MNERARGISLHDNRKNLSLLHYFDAYRHLLV